MRFSLMYLKSQRSIDQISSTQHCFQDSQSAKGWVPSLQWHFNVSWGNTEQIEKTRGHTAHIKIGGEIEAMLLRAKDTTKPKTAAKVNCVVQLPNPTWTMFLHPAKPSNPRDV